MVDLFENKNFDNLVNLSNMEAERQMKVFSNFVSPEFIERERQKGKVTFLEAAQNAKKWGYATPFFGTALEMGNNAVVLNTLNKLKSGAVLSNEENSQLKEYVQDMASLSARGMTLPANCMNSFMENVPFLFEFGTAFATAPTGVGFAGVGQAGAKLAARQLAKKGVKDLTKKVINRQVAKNVLKDSTVGVGRMMLQKEMMLNNAKRYTDVQLADKLYLTEEGQAILNESEQSPAKALLKTIGLQGIEILSETTGFAFGGVGKWLGHGLASKLPKKFVDELGSTINKVTGLAPYKALKKYGWNGVVEEMGEERAGDLLKVAFNLDDEKGYSYEQFLNALYPGKEELLTEAITFAITGGLMGGAVELHNKHKKNEIYHTVVNDIKSECTNEDGSFDFDKMKTLVKENMPSISDERLNKYIDTVKNDIKNVKDYSVEDFLLDSGVFRQTGRYGVVDKAVLNALKDSDMSDEDKMNILNYVSTTDKKNFVNLMSKLNPDSNVTPERQKLANYVQNSFYNQLSKNGVPSNIAFSTSVLFSNLAKKSTVDVEKFKQWFDKTYITTEDLPAKMKQGLFQSAMYKSPNVNNQEEGIYVNGKFIPKYTERKTLKKESTKAHFEGDYTSPKINKILYFLKDGHTLEETIDKFETSEYPKEHITEIYNKFKDGIYKFVEATPDEYENKKYVNSEYQDSIDYNKSVDEVFDKISDDYYEKTHSGVKTGNGYSSYSMSNNAVDAYNRSNKPMSKWTKKAILDEIKSIGEEYNLKFDFERLKKENVSELRKTILAKNGYHHTSKNYNATDFYCIDLENLYDNGYILDRLNKYDIHYQQENSSVAQESIEKTVQDKFGYSVDELTENIKQDVINALADNNISDSEFNIQDIRLYGSYSKGTNKATSDLDFIVQYDGSMKEDNAFNILHDVINTIEDKNGNKVTVDINPINVNESGTIDEHIAYMNNLNENTHFQSINTAGANKKYLNTKQSTLKNFYDVHRNFTEKEPEQYNGKKTIKNVLEYLGSKNNKTAKIKTPIEKITITRNNVIHLLKDNEKERSNYINRFIRTLQNPNLVIKSIENNKIYNYYIKSFSGENNKISGHVQIIKKCSDGNFYVTNHHLTNGKITKVLKNGQIIYDLSDLSAVQNAPDTNSITDVDTDFNPDINIFFQSAYHGTPHKFDEFSTEHIGTGEGAQAHGWGLYFAGNKDVSENYRKELARINNLDLFGPVPVNVYYDGKHATEYSTFADFSLALELVGTQDKKAGIDYLKNEINECQKRIDEFKEDIKKRPMETPAFKQQIEDEQDYISELNKQIDFINNLDVNKLEVEKRNQGQLFEVDIPENDVLLDEDKELIHQPDKVQRAIEKIYADAMKSNNVELTNAIGITGKEIYRGFSKYFGSDKKASEFLNSYGIKGITYDGRQDGRCYVIFDDKAINVIKTYYQSMLSGIDKDQKVNVLDLTSAFGSDANLSKKDLTNYIKSLIGSNPISTSDKKAIVNFIARSKRTGKGNVYIPSHIANSSKVETNNKGVRNTVVNNIVDLIKNSVLIDKSENRDKQTKPNVDYYYRCYVPVRVNNDIYTVRITLENNEKDNLFNIINGNVYDVIIDKKMTSAHSMTNSQSSLMKSSSNSNIPQNNKNVTSDQITIEDMLKDVLDSEGNSYFQNDEDSETKQKLLTENIEQKKNDLENKLTELTWSDSSEDNSSMIESISQDIETLEKFLEKGGYDEISAQSQADEESKELLSAVQKIMGVQKKSKPLKDSYSELLARRKQEEEKYKGFFIQQNDKNIIGILSNSDSSTIIHEMGHLFLSGLNEFAQYDEESKKQLEMVNSWLGSNGSEYTTEQAEKFARSFEAYLYKGKAPNVGLRGVFEKFKDWLHSIYVNISSIPGADISDEAQEVFDRLFSGEEYFEKVKAINTLVKKINNIRVAKSYTDMEKRHRQAAYEVVAVATGYPVNYIRNILGSKSNSKRIEKLKENILSKVEHTDDKLTIHGYNPEWAEFGYSLADVEDATNDIEVAQKAYDDLLNQSFMTEVVDEYGLSDDADVQYKTLLKEYKKNKSNRDVVLGAFYDWIESLTDIEKDFFSEKFENDVSYIERFEKLDKFEQAKITILEKARELKTFGKGSEYENYKALVVETMKNLNFLTPSDKARMTTTILDMPSLTFLESGIDSILDIAKTLDDRAYRKHLMDLINKEIQSTKNVKQGNKTVGKYDYLTNKVFEEIREYNKLSVEQANEKRLALANLTEAEENGLTFEQKLIMKFLTYKANGTRYGTTENVKSMYDDICLMKKLGKKCKSDMELFEKLNNKHQIDELVNILKNKKKAKGIAKFYNNCVANWESCLNFIFNKSIKDKHSLLIPETNTMVWIHNAKKKFESQVANIYGLKSWNFDHAILDNLATKDTFIETTNRKYDLEGKLSSCDFVERELNKMQMLHVWIGYQNDVIKQRLINQWGEENIERMFNYLTDKDEALGRLLISTCQSFYPEVNNVFINKYGIDLPKVQSYFPSTPRHESEVDLLTDFAMKSSSPSMIKHRTKAETLPMELHNPVEIIYNHIDKCGRFINMTYKLDILNKIFKSETVEKMVSEIYGKDAYKTLKQQLVNVSYKTNSTVFDGYKKMLNGVISNWIQGNVIIRPIVGLKQLLSASNYAVDMPVTDWSKGFLKALVHPKQTIDYMMKIPYLQARYNGSAQNEFLKETIENSKFAKVKTLKEFLSLNIRMGDIGAIIFGGKPYIDYLIKTGMSEDEAIEQFILSTQRSQQSSATSSLGNFQIDMGKNPFGKLFTAYKNSPYQYIRMCSDAIISVANGDMTKRQCAKVLFNFAYFQPLLYTLATSGSVFRLLFSGDDDDLKSDLITSLFNLNANAFAFIGDVYQFALDRLVYKNKYLPQSTPLLGDLQTEIMKISKEDVSLEDYLGLSAEIIHIGTGIPAGKVWEQLTSVGDFADGDVATGLMKMLGYTSKRAKHITNSDND